MDMHCTAGAQGRPQTFSAAEAVRIEPADLTVPEGAEWSTADRAVADHVHAIRLESFGDLQLLGFVPRGLDERAVREAIKKDDERALGIAEQRFASAGEEHACSCNGHAGNGRTHASLSAHWKEVRRSFNPNLASLLGEHHRIRLEAFAPAVQLVRKWASALDKGIGRVEILAPIFQDVTINRNATLKLGAKEKVMLARNIYIHHTGRLVTGSAYTRIWANSIQELGRFASLSPADLARIPWRLAA